MFFISPGYYSHPKRNWKQCLVKVKKKTPQKPCTNNLAKRRIQKDQSKYIKLKTLQSRRLFQGLIKQREIELSCYISIGQYQSSSGLLRYHSYSSKASKSAFLRSLNMADTYIEPWQLHSRFQSCDPFGSFGLRGGSSECGNGRKLKGCYLRILNTNLYLGSMPLLSHAYWLLCDQVLQQVVHNWLQSRVIPSIFLA